jgi:hypothetical protein
MDSNMHKFFPPLIGLRIKDAFSIAKDRKYFIRVISFNGNKIKNDTKDFIYHRINVDLMQGIVVSYDFY